MVILSERNDCREGERDNCGGGNRKTDMSQGFGEGVDGYPPKKGQRKKV